MMYIQGFLHRLDTVLTVGKVVQFCLYRCGAGATYRLASSYVLGGGNHFHDGLVNTSTLIAKAGETGKNKTAGLEDVD